MRALGSQTLGSESLPASLSAWREAFLGQPAEPGSRIGKAVFPSVHLDPSTKWRTVKFPLGEPRQWAWLGQRLERAARLIAAHHHARCQPHHDIQGHHQLPLHSLSVAVALLALTLVRSLLIAAVAFMLMEPFTYAAHRWVMHGIGERLHRSHHANAARSKPALIETNDLYPVAFAGIVMALLALGFNVSGFAVLVPVCIGITVYGATYFTVHDVYIHRRIRLWGESKPAVLEHLADAHRTHHATNGEPYGMLFPIVRQAKGFAPSQVPVES